MGLHLFVAAFFAAINAACTSHVTRRTEPAQRIQVTHVANKSSVQSEFARQNVNQKKIGINSSYRHAQPSCSSLTNQGGSYFSVHLGVGTPRQFFNVILDTGSDNVLIPWCGCIGRDPSLPCFTPPDSSTFSVSDFIALEAFGSGDVFSAISSDFVSVNNSVAYMKDSLLVMLIMTLDVPNVDGILGMGNPAGDGVPSFLHEAGLDRFSICVDQAGGQLRLGSDAALPPGVPKLGSIGVNHWALGLFGVSVAGTNATACSPQSVQGGTQTPCGAIIDSGTTNIMGPSAELIALYTTICDHWPRCHASAANSGIPSSTEFVHLLGQCVNWINQGQGIGELPDIQFHVVGVNGTGQTLTISPAFYTYTTLTPAGNQVCAPSFSVMDVSLGANGPAWILGLPIFLSYRVYFSLRGSGAISFQTGACQDCAASSSGSAAPAAADSLMPYVRQGPARAARINRSAPL